MKVSVNKIDEFMAFLVNKLLLEPSAIVKCPEVVELSVQKNFVPRVALCKQKSELYKEEMEVKKFQLEEKKRKLKEKATRIARKKRESYWRWRMQRFVNCYDEAPKLMKLYQEKLELSKMKKK
ncbi:hypothetical protein Ddye_021409 [Dipteronia dyeriana]|uniref:Uncharacterized protein n=1 Tax=Dipteronia dyeriana TaxID=168575 RepID=A0AAD9WW91_9ROSI|nr:hypothetical protein Ddye_021409 [Dipteronia dyeriana]